MKKLLLLAAALAAMISGVSCKKEKPQPDNPKESEIVVYATIAEWAQAKMLPEVQDGNAENVFLPKWKKGDVVTGFYSEDGKKLQVNYEVEEVEDGGRAKFKKTGDFKDPKNGTKVHLAYLQGCEASELKDGNIEISLKNQPERALPAIMTASGEVKDGQLSLSFTSRVAVIGLNRPTLDGYNETGISKLTVSGTGIISEGTLDLATGTFKVGKEASYVSVNAGTTEQETIMLSIIPGIKTDLKLTIEYAGFEYAMSCTPFTPGENGYYYFLNPDFNRAPGYIPINWDTDISSKNFNAASGNIELVFKGDAPRMKKYDVITIPDDAGEFHIRVISSAVETKSGTEVSLLTTEGKMGNLFKNTRFTLSTSGTTETKAPMVPVYTPSRVEIFDGTKYITVAGGGTTKAEGEMSKELFKWENNLDGMELWTSGPLSLSWEQCNFEIGLTGTFEFDFGEVPWEDVGIGDLNRLAVCLEGGFNSNLVLKIAAAAEAELKKEKTLKEDIVKARFTFMVGPVPVYVSVGADLMAEMTAAAEGEVSVSGGASASMTAKFGVEWNKGKGGSIIYGIEKNIELIGPSIDAHAHVEGGVATYPSIKIGLYSVLCPTINPKPYIKAEADARLVEQSYLGWNAGISTGIDLETELNLDLFFFEEKLVEFEPMNLLDLPIVRIPDALSLTTETPAQMKVGESKEIKYSATNKNLLSGKKYNAAGMLVHFEAEGGELDKEYAYTDGQGDVSVNFTLHDNENANVKAEIVLGNEEGDKVEADLWEVEIFDFRLSASPLSQTIGDDGNANITFKLEKYSSISKEWAPEAGRTLNFTAVGGTCPSSGVTAGDGTVSISFTAEEDFNEGSVTADFGTNTPIVWSGSVKAEILAEEEEGEPGDVIFQLEKTKRMKKNTVRIGEEVIEIVKGENDYVALSEGEGDDGDVYFEWCHERPPYSTVFGGNLREFYKSMVGHTIRVNDAEWSSGIYFALLYIVNPEAPYEEWINQGFHNGNIADGAIIVEKHEADNSYSFRFYFLRDDGLQGWGHLSAQIEK